MRARIPPGAPRPRGQLAQARSGVLTVNVADGTCPCTARDEVTAELARFKFAWQRSKLAGTIGGTFFVIEGEY